MARMQTIADHLMSGATEWAIKARASGGEGVDSGLVVRAMLHAGLGSDVEAVERVLTATIAKGKAADRKAALKLWAGTSKVITAMAELKARATTIDADSLLEEVLAEGPELGEGEEAPF